MSAKHFWSDPTALVAGALKAVTIVNPAVVLDLEQKVLRHICSDDQPSRISIISGGGSGHEPAFGAYVGEGLLTASVAGTIFASPSSRQIQHAISKVDSSKGILVTVMNYTGDVLNFGVAVEKARVQNPDMKIDMLVVGDDVGVPRSQAGKVGRRGIAGTVLVHKITGALAAAGYDLSTIVQVGKLVCQNLVTVGASLDRVHVPGQDEGAEHSLAAGEIELGMGIHNEAGSGRKSGQDAKLPALADEMLRQLLDPSDDERAFLANKTESMVLLINNLGGLSVLELGSITTQIVDRLHGQYNINLARVFAGTFMTSLNGPGFSITLLSVVPSSFNVGLLELLDAPCEAPGWSAPVRTATWAREKRNSTSIVEETKSISPLPSVSSQLIFDELALVQALKRGLQRLIDVEPDVTHFDTVVGDGDCGTTLKRGAQALLEVCKKVPSDLPAFLTEISEAIEHTMDGTSGALYSIFLNALTTYVKTKSKSPEEVNVKFWTDALDYAVETLGRYTPAQRGDRTLVDALHPFLDTLHSTGNVQTAAKASLKGAEESKGMTAKLGRAVYVGDAHEWVGKIPDPGAWGLSHFLLGLAGIQGVGEECYPQEDYRSPSD